MPPKKRGRPTATAAPQPEPEPGPELVASDDDASNQSDQDQNSEPGSDLGSDADQSSRETEFKFFNTTFSTFRVSPLYIAQNNLTPAGLETLSRRLRDTLVGDVVRGVQVGLEGDNATLGRLGTLERVEWRECSLATMIPSLVEAEEGMDDEARHRRRGGGIQRGRGRRARETRRRHLLCLELEYEKTTFSALLLPSLDEKHMERDGDNDDDDGESPLRNPPSWTQNSTNPRDKLKSKSKEDQEDTTTTAFAHYPLLLTRMPAALKSALLDFLSSTFDCRISALRLGTRSLIGSWERWIGGARERALSKDVALTLGFHLEPPLSSKTTGGASAHDEEHEQEQAPVVLGLKTIDVVVPADEVRRFLRAGRKGIADSDGHNKNGKRPSDPAAAAEEEEEGKGRLRRRRLGGGRDEEGWWWISQSRQLPSQTPPEQSKTPNPDDDDDEQPDPESPETFPQPFTTALATYLSHHLALDLFHPGVRVLRVVCDAFALSEGRVKVFVPRGGGDAGGGGEGGGGEDVEVFVRDLIRRAQGRNWGADALRLAGLEVWG
ncbi:kinetochore complex Sim4 subunit Fta1-domain-containing protein [Xylaria castorea]|nr:kinetochore complex Sim4 subunit Fta1-domain-containing protein [Xylaria castorea]